MGRLMKWAGRIAILAGFTSAGALFAGSHPWAASGVLVVSAIAGLWIALSNGAPEPEPRERALLNAAPAMHRILRQIVAEAAAAAGMQTIPSDQAKIAAGFAGYVGNARSVLQLADRNYAGGAAADVFGALHWRNQLELALFRNTHALEPRSMEQCAAEAQKLEGRNFALRAALQRLVMEHGITDLEYINLLGGAERHGPEKSE